MGASTPIAKTASNEKISETILNTAVHVSTNNGNSDTIEVDAKTSKENEILKHKIKDLEEKLETLKLKRAEDRDKLREHEKLKLQIQQVKKYRLFHA